MVRPDRRSQHCTPPLAIRRLGGKTPESRAELESARLGRHCSQDSPVDSNHEQQDSGPYAMESCGIEK